VHCFSLTSDWTCDKIISSSLSGCSTPDDEYGDDELWSGMPKRYTRLVEHDAFYRRLITLLKESTDSGEADYSAELEKFPQIRRQPANLYTIYRRVLALGGYERVCASNQWRTIQSCLLMDEKYDSSQSLKRLYQRILLPYEQRFWKHPRGTNATRTITPPVPVSGKGINGPSSRSTRLTAAATYATSMYGGGAATAAIDSSNRKRHQKHMRNDEGFESDEEQSHKRVRHEYLDEDSDVSENEEKGERSVPQSQLSTRLDSASVTAVITPVLSDLSTAVRSLRTSVDSKLRAFEKRMDDRLNRMESALSKAIRDATAALTQTVTSSVAAQKSLHERQYREQQRKDDLIARGLNMIIAERVKAALPRLTQAKQKATARGEKEKTLAAAGVAVTAVPKSTKPASVASPPAAAASVPASVASPSNLNTAVAAPVFKTAPLRIFDDESSSSTPSADQPADASSPTHVEHTVIPDGAATSKLAGPLTPSTAKQSSQPATTGAHKPNSRAVQAQAHYALFTSFPASPASAAVAASSSSVKQGSNSNSSPARKVDVNISGDSSSVSPSPSNSTATLPKLEFKPTPSQKSIIDAYFHQYHNPTAAQYDELTMSLGEMNETSHCREWLVKHFQRKRAYAKRTAATTNTDAPANRPMELESKTVASDN
jgi:hypothetical protein